MIFEMSERLDSVRERSESLFHLLAAFTAKRVSERNCKKAKARDQTVESAERPETGERLR